MTDEPKILSKYRIVKWPEFSTGEAVAIYPDDSDGFSTKLLAEGTDVPEALRRLANNIEDGTVSSHTEK